MNGVLNVIAAFLVASGMVGGVWMISDREANSDTLSEVELAAYKEQVRDEVSSDLAANCENLTTVCESQELKVTELEQPYAPGVAMSGGETASNDPATSVDGQPTAASSDSYRAEQPTAVLGASFGGDDGDSAEQETNPVDKPDSDEYFTENRTLRDGAVNEVAEQTTQTQPVDKPDSQEYFTENRRTDGTPVDKPDSEQYFTENRRTDGTPVDKPDSGQYFTENKPFDDPCIRDDGTRYTGPGTATDPFAEGDPCLTEQRIVQRTTPVDKPDDSDYFTEFKPFNDPCIRDDGTRYTGPGTVTDPNAPGDPCLTEQRFVEKIPPYVPEKFEDPCEEGRMMPQVNEFLDENDPCVTDTRTPPPQIVEVPPETSTPPFTPPAPPPVLTWTSPYQDPGPDFPRTTLGPRGSDYPMQVTMVYDPYY